MTRGAFGLQTSRGACQGCGCDATRRRHVAGLFQRRASRLHGLHGFLVKHGRDPMEELLVESGKTKSRAMKKINKKKSEMCPGPSLCIIVLTTLAIFTQCSRARSCGLFAAGAVSLFHTISFSILVSVRVHSLAGVCVFSSSFSESYASSPAS